ncbi:MAG TPA: hypothetical protein PLB55_11800, partial [Prosthecobacter sp.]|nr:hypothetical protein [Prosthecobacter sp.]
RLADYVVFPQSASNNTTILSPGQRTTIAFVLPNLDLSMKANHQLGLGPQGKFPDQPPTLFHFDVDPSKPATMKSQLFDVIDSNGRHFIGSLVFSAERTDANRWKWLDSKPAPIAQQRADLGDQGATNGEQPTARALNAKTPSALDAKPKTDKLQNDVPFQGEPKLRYVAWFPKDGRGWQLQTPAGEPVTAPGNIPAETWDLWTKRWRERGGIETNESENFLTFFFSHPAIDAKSGGDLTLFDAYGTQLNHAKYAWFGHQPVGGERDGWYACGGVPMSNISGRNLKVRIGLTAGPWDIEEPVSARKDNAKGGSRFIFVGVNETAGHEACVSVVSVNDDKAVFPQWEVLGKLREGSLVSPGIYSCENFTDTLQHTYQFARPVTDFETFYFRTREVRFFNYDGVQVPPLPRTDAGQTPPKPVIERKVEKVQNDVPFTGEPQLRYVAWQPKNASEWQLRTPKGEAVTVPGDIPHEAWDEWRKDWQKRNAGERAETETYLTFFYSHPAIDDHSESHVTLFHADGTKIPFTKFTCHTHEPIGKEEEGWFANGRLVPPDLVGRTLKVQISLTAGPWTLEESVPVGEIGRRGGPVHLGYIRENADHQTIVTVDSDDDDPFPGQNFELLGKLREGSVVSFDSFTVMKIPGSLLIDTHFVQPLAAFESFFIRRRERKDFIFDGVQVPPLPK